MTTNWKTIRVFISSTLRDMQAERDHLVRFVFPRQREQLLPRRIHLVPEFGQRRGGGLRIERRRWQTASRLNQSHLAVSVGGLQIHHQPVNISP